MSSSSTLDVAGNLIGSTTNITDFIPRARWSLTAPAVRRPRKPSKR